MIAMKILLVEDEEPVRFVFKRLMGDMTSKIVECDTLVKALAAVGEDDFDLVILDLRLLDADKDETLQHIPDFKRRNGTPVIVVTGFPDPDIEQKAKAAGADYCIPKGDMFSRSKAMLMALHAAIVKHPRAHPGNDYLSHVEMLERLVRAAA